MAGYNKTLGKFQLVGIPPAPRGVPQVEVTFDIDANGILSVSAKDRGTGNEQKIEVRSGSGLSDDEINRMVQDAEAHADDDRRLRDLADARNQARAAIYSIEKSLREHGDKVDEAIAHHRDGHRRPALGARGRGRRGDPRAHAGAHEASYKLAEAVYRTPARARLAAPRAAARRPTGESEEEVIEDAEIVDEGEQARS